MRRKRESVRYHNPFRERKVGMSRIRWCVQLSCKDDWKNARVPWFDENIDVDKKNIEKKRWLFWLGRLCLLHSDVAQYYNGHRDAFFEHHEPRIFNIVDHALEETSKTMNTLSHRAMCSLRKNQCTDLFVCTIKTFLVMPLMKTRTWISTNGASLEIMLPYEATFLTLELKMLKIVVRISYACF